MKYSMIIFFLFFINFICFSDEMTGKIKNGDGKGMLYCKMIFEDGYDVHSETVPEIYDIEHSFVYENKLFFSQTEKNYISIFDFKGNYISDIQLKGIPYNFIVVDNYIFFARIRATNKKDKNGSVIFSYLVDRTSLNSGKTTISFGKNGIGKNLESFNNSEIYLKTYGNHILVYGSDVREFDTNGNLIRIYPTAYWDKDGVFYSLNSKNDGDYLLIFNENGKILKELKVFEKPNIGTNICSLIKIDDKIFVEESWATNRVKIYKRYGIDGKIIETKEVKASKFISLNDDSEDIRPINDNYYLKIKNDFIEIWKKN